MSLPARAYPAQFIETWIGGTDHYASIRPVRSEDAALIAQLMAGLSPQTRYQRHFSAGEWADREVLDRLTGADYQHTMALIAVAVAQGRELAVGLAEYVLSEEAADACEFAVLVADAWQGRGLGRHLLERMIECARAAGLTRMDGYVLATNRLMIALAQRCGFRPQPDDDPWVLRLSKPLTAADIAQVPQAAAAAVFQPCHHP